MLLPPLQSAMIQIIEKEPDVDSMHTLLKQFRLLLVGLIQRALDPSVKTCKIVVIGAPDECTNPEFAPDMPLKFFISSRDTTQIRSAFRHNPHYTPAIVSLHAIERTVVQEDIKLYLHTCLSVIVRNYLLSIPWPPLDEFDILLKRSDGLFIYAATALRYIIAPDVDFRERLTHITCLTPARMQTGVIDSLYNDIMWQAFCSQLEPEDVSRRQKMLYAVVFLVIPLSMEAITSVLEPVKLLVFGMHTQSPKSFYRDVTNKKRNLILCCSTTPEII